MNIVITGATGFIGKHLVKELIKKHNVYILIRPSSNYSFLEVDNIITFNDQNESEIENLGETLKKEKIDGIIHLASLYLAQHKNTEIKDLILSNIYLGTALLEACKYSGVKWFLNTGSIWQNYEAEDYSDTYNPVNLYAATKQAFMTISKYYTETTNIRFSTLKLCDTYGPNDTRKKIYSLFEQIAKSGELLDMSPGEQLIDIVHIDNVVDKFISLINILAEKNKEYREEYVVTSGKQISLKKLASQYEKEHNVKLHINWGGRSYRDREVMKPYKGYSI